MTEARPGTRRITVGADRVFGRLPGTDAMRGSEAGVRKASKEETAGNLRWRLCRVMGI